MSDDEFKQDDKTQEGKPWWTEAVKDLTSAGLATFFMTEDSIRTYLKEKKLPKELIAAFLDGVSRKRDDLYSSVTNEMTRMLSRVDLTREVTRFLEAHSLKIDARIQFEKKGGTDTAGADVPEEPSSGKPL